MSNILLSTIIPIGEMSERLSVLEKWLTNVDSAQLQVILVCDLAGNNCFDKLTEIVRKLADKHIELHSGLFGSPGLARNFGLKHAVGDWIAFWDSDDVPSWKRNLEVLKDNFQFEIIIGAFEKINEIDRSVVPVMFLGNDSRSIENSLVANPGLWRFLFRREVLTGLQFREFRMAEDQVFLLTTNPFSRRIKIVDEILYSYHWGGPGHLVDNRFALNDLLKAMREIKLMLRGEFLASRDFARQLLAKQAITALRHGDIKMKILSLGIISPLPRNLKIPYFYRIYLDMTRLVYRSFFVD